MIENPDLLGKGDILVKFRSSDLVIDSTNVCWMLVSLIVPLGRTRDEMQGWAKILDFCLHRASGDFHSAVLKIKKRLKFSNFYLVIMRMLPWGGDGCPERWRWNRNWLGGEGQRHVSDSEQKEWHVQRPWGREAVKDWNKELGNTGISLFLPPVASVAKGILELTISMSFQATLLF